MPNIRNKKFLIVDDEGDICLLLNIMLADKNTSIEHAHTIADAKASLQSYTPDVIVLDNRLPDGLGSDFASEIREAGNGTKVLMISGVSDEEQSNYLSSRSDYFLAKPFTRQQMKEALETLLQPEVEAAAS